jgi:hypothetical protein
MARSDRRCGGCFDMGFIVLTRRLFCAAMLVAGVLPVAAHNEPGYALLERAAAALRGTEPQWEFIAATFMNVPKLLDEQLGVAGGSWRRRGERGEDVHVSVTLHRVSTEEAIARWMSDDLRRVRKDRWVVMPYELGDRATLAIMDDTYRQVTWYQLSFQRGRYLASLNGQSKKDVERLARYVLAEMRER